MAKPEWGVKRACPSCAVRFYDLMRDPIVCPSCGATFSAEALAKPRRGRAAAAPEKVVAKPVPEAEDVEADATDDDDDDVLDLDDSDETPVLKETEDGEVAEDGSAVSNIASDETLPDDEDDAAIDGDDDEVSLEALEEEDLGDEDEDEDNR